MKTVDIIIPTYKPDKKFLMLMERLAGQTYPIHQIIIANTEEKYFERLIYGTNFTEKYKNTLVFHLSKREFDHGNTRSQAIKRSQADIFVCMTQDAVPDNENLIQELVNGLSGEKTAAAYAKQLPAQDCGVVEAFTRQFNYPDEPMVKSLEDIDRLGIKTFFCSNVCAAYKRDIYDTIGGFIRHTIFNEDMIYAAGAVKAGYQIAYAPSARVVHSHNYTNWEQFMRNFDLGVSQADHPEVFSGVPSGGEGRKLVKQTRKFLAETKNRKLILPMYTKSAFKLAGYVLGCNYRKLPEKLVLKFSSNKQYWRRNHIINANTKINPSSGYGKTESERMMIEKPIKRGE